MDNYFDDTKKNEIIYGLQKQYKESLKGCLKMLLITTICVFVTVFLFIESINILKYIALLITIFMSLIFLVSLYSLNKISNDIDVAKKNIIEYLKIEEKRRSDSDDLKHTIREYEITAGLECPHCHFRNPSHISINNVNNAKIKLVVEEGVESFYCHSCYNSFASNNKNRTA